MTVLNVLWLGPIGTEVQSGRPLALTDPAQCFTFFKKLKWERFHKIMPTAAPHHHTRFCIMNIYWTLKRSLSTTESALLFFKKWHIILKIYILIIVWCVYCTGLESLSANQSTWFAQTIFKNTLNRMQYPDICSLTESLLSPKKMLRKHFNATSYLAYCSKLMW